MKTILHENRLPGLLSAKCKRALLSLLFTGMGYFLFGQTTVFVKSGGSGTGTSFTNAYGSLTSALAASGTNQLNIYIAAGTYNGAYTIPSTRNVYIKGGYPTSASGNDTSGYNPTANVVNIGQTSSSGTTFSYGGASSKQFSLIGVKLTGSSTTFSAPVFNTTSTISNSTLLFKDVLIVNNSTNGRSSDGLFSFKTSLSGSTVDFENTIFGTASGSANSNSGTAIYWSGTGTSTFVFNNSALNYETTQSGDISAGLYLVGSTGSTFSITNSSFCNNAMSASNDEGTSVYISGSGTYTINNDYFSNNTSNANYAGAAINIDALGGTANINNSTFLSNTATKSGSAYGGGAVYIGTSTGVHFNNDIFYGNSSSSYGGAVYARNSSTFDVKNSYFYNNTASSGGGAIDLYNSTSASLDAVYFAGNKIGASSTTLGADIYYNSSSGNYTSITNSYLQLSSSASYTTSSHFTFGSGNTFNYSTVGSSPSGSCKTAVSLYYSISGNVYDDANGLADNTVNGTGTNAGNTLYANLVDANGNVYAVTTVAANGTYSFTNVIASNYTVIVTTTAGTVGSALSAASLPAGYVSTGENIGTTAGNDGTVDGKLSIVLTNANISNANFGITQAGYIYVHKKTLDESSSTDFTFAVSGGSTTVPSFSLNDNPTQVALQDIGSSQSGRLWAVGTNSTLYYRDLGTAIWTATSVTTASRVDGASGNACYYINTSGSVIYFDGTTSTTIGAAANYGSSNASDIGSAWDSQPYITTAAGAIYRYSGGGTTWSQVGATTNNLRIDGNPSSGTIVVSKSDGLIYSITAAGVQTSLGAATGTTGNATDVAVDASGTIYAAHQTTSISAEAVYKWTSGTTWGTAEVTARNVKNITGGVGGQLWGINLSLGSPYNNIFTRSVDGSGNIWWQDDERARTSPANGNSEMIAVIPGSYTITETVPSGWDLQNISLYDPSNNSTSNVAGNAASLNVAAGEVVHAVIQNGAVNVFTMTNSCASSYLENFGTGATGTFGAALTGQTSYHYLGVSGNAEDGYYKVVSQTNPDFRSTSASYYDHTSNNGTGRMMVVNASYSPDEFFRRRFNGLVIGATYNFSAWILNVSNSSVLPNVTFNVIDPTSYSIIATNNTGNIAIGSGWKQYTLSFTASAATIDLVLVNNTVGGNGNDLALDDISFSMVPVPAGSLTTSITYNPSSGCSVSGNLQYTSPTGSSYLYSKDGTTYQSGTTFSTLTPGIYTTYVTYSGTTGCASSHIDTVLASVCGNVYDDANGLKDTPSGKVNGTATNAGGTLNAVLYDNTAGKVSAVTAVAADGTYSTRAGIFNDSYTTYLTTAATTVGQAATPAVTLPSGWANVGENLGSAAGSDGTVDGKLPLGTINANVTNANFGIDQLPSGTDLAYVIAVPTRGSTHPLNNTYRNLLPLTYYDPEDCQSVCPSNFGVIIQSLGSMNGNQLAYNGINITPSNVPYTIANYKPDSLTITFNQLGVSSFSFYYKLVDAAGVQSIDPIYTVSWGSNVLAVNLLSFTAEQQGAKALLKWSTAAGSPNDKFMIERSADGRNWQALATVSGKGNTATKQDYSYTDSSPLNGDNYYRIQQKDNSGSSSYSETKLLKFGEEWKVSLYPNPVAAGNTVKLISNQSLKQIKITDLQGRVVAAKSIPVATTGGSMNEELNITRLTAGSYLVQVMNNSGKMQALKLVKVQ